MAFWTETETETAPQYKQHKIHQKQLYQVIAIEIKYSFSDPKDVGLSQLQENIQRNRKVTFHRLLLPMLSTIVC